jgi:hypothetical protein
MNDLINNSDDIEFRREFNLRQEYNSIIEQFNSFINANKAGEAILQDCIEKIEEVKKLHIKAYEEKNEDGSYVDWKIREENMKSLESDFGLYLNEFFFPNLMKANLLHRMMVNCYGQEAIDAFIEE